jgi:pimeloyl-ACP methyl ester carboxylesterase
MQRREKRWALAGAAIVLVAGCGSSDPANETDPTGPAGADADFAGTVDIGNGRSMYVECRGSGAPTVVLVTGLGERADNWMITAADPTSAEGSVFPAIAESTRVCAYDRPGTRTVTATGVEESRSSPVAGSATVADSAQDLDAMLAASDESGPYVLVGHSLGGPIIRLYAAAHPDEVAGLVFDDALSEDLGQDLTPAQRADYARLNTPEAQGRPLDGERDLFEEAVIPLLRAAPPAPEVPTVVLTADTWLITDEVIESGALPDFVTQEFSDALWASQRAAQDQLAARFPWAEHVTDTGGSHYLHLDNPQLVIDSIGGVVDQVRSAPSG